jgi:hydrogenase maturation protease
LSGSDARPSMTQAQRRISLIIGLGSDDRGDDAAGLLIASRLNQVAGDRIKVVQQRGDALALIDTWEDATTVIIIDAAVSGADTGTIHRIDASTRPLPRNLLHHSTHSFGVSQAIELARATDRLPSRVIVYGVEGANFEPGAKLSAEVEAAACEVEALVLADIGCIRL